MFGFRQIPTFFAKQRACHGGNGKIKTTNLVRDLSGSS